MLFHLVKKDFILAKKYWLIMIIFAIVFPLYINFKPGVPMKEFIAFFLVTLFIQFIMFNTVSLIEYKYKGSILLCTTPYTRKAIVLSKYIFLLIIFAGCYILNTLLSLIFPKIVDGLNVFEIGISFLIVTLIFGVVIPMQYYFGYEKSKYIFSLIIFLSPFLSSFIIKSLQSNSISVSTMFPLSPILQICFLGLSAVLIGWFSFHLSLKIYSKQNL